MTQVRFKGYFSAPKGTPAVDIVVVCVVDGKVRQVLRKCRIFKGTPVYVYTSHVGAGLVPARSGIETTILFNRL